MRKAAIWSLPILLLGLLCLRAVGQQPNNTPMSFTGEIMDNECAAAGSHTDYDAERRIQNCEGLRAGLREGWRAIRPFWFEQDYLSARRSRETCRLRGPEGHRYWHL